jgi:hypothetical protein
MAKTKIDKSMVNDMPVGDVVGLTDSQTLTNKTLTTPTIGDFTNATHDHTSSAEGGTLTSSAVGLGNVTNVATSDTAYNATTWNTNSDAATKNAIRDKINTMDSSISSNTPDDTAYNATTWNTNSDSATKNAIRDKIETMNTAIGLNTTDSHANNADTALGSGCVALDHGTASTDQVVNVCYGTSATPPTANTTTIGALYIQYTA